MQGLRSISRINGLSYKMHPKQPQSISITSPDSQIRICFAFCKLKKTSVRIKLRGKSKEGGRSPLLGRFKGDCQGGRVPTRIQRSDSCGKRRNNGTDDACPPQAADRMRDVEFVPTQIPLCWFPFHRQRPFPLSSKEKGAEYRPYGSIPFNGYDPRSGGDGAPNQTAPSAHTKHSAGFPGKNSAPGQ